MEDEDYDEETEVGGLHDYFTNRPVIFMIYFTLSFLVSVFGIGSNAILILTKVRRFAHLRGLELLIINLSMAMITLSVMFLILLTDDMFHEFSDKDYLCNIKWFLQGISQTGIAFSSISLIIVSKYFSKIDRKYAMIVISVIWMCAIIDAYPYFGFEVIPLSLSNGDSRNVCHLSISKIEDFNAFRRHQLTMMFFEFALPTLLLIITSCISFLWKLPETSTNQVIFLYSLSITIFYTLINSPLVINRFTATRGIAEMNHSVRYLFRFLLNSCVLANTIIYGYFDDFYIKEGLNLLRVGDHCDDISYDQHQEEFDNDYDKDNLV